VSIRRRSDAPRLVEWTGERCVPWASDVQVVYEHLHRYMWAAQWVRGCRVLDLASGEGFGAAILAETAISVVGIDIDPLTVEHSRLNYGSERLDFQVGDALDLERFPVGHFDAVVAFEMVEHVEDHDRLLAQIRHVLRPGGLLVMSTPDRHAYEDTRREENPYHVHELDTREFVSLLSGQFANLRMWGQRTVAGSAMHQLEGGQADSPASMMFVQREGDEWHPTDLGTPVYLVALASDSPLPDPAWDSMLADVGLGLVEAERERIVTEYARGSGPVEGLGQHESELLRELARRDLDLSDAQRQIQQLRDTIVSLQQEYGRSIQMMRRVEESITWSAFQRIRQRAFGLAGGEKSRPVQAFQWTLRTAAGRTRQARARRSAVVSASARRLAVVPTSAGASAADPAIEFPRFSAPEVSIVIPVFRQAELTRRCLRSILEHTSLVPYEVILVDDAADQENRALLASVQRANLIVNPENLGYLRSVNRGAAEARGRWLVLANNDIEVQPGWLAELVGCGDCAPDIAVVTPRYLYPDGSLSEAGGIIFSDGTGANYGRGDHADSWRYGYRRDVDYGSAAALLVRADFWRDRGGYDETFLPMYYEDTDLCFEARERGLRVVYEPEAIVVHHEGGTAGTDPSTGYKRHQEENRLKFVTKWASRLQADHPAPGSPPSLGGLRRGSRPHVLIVDHRVPMPDRDSGSLRMQTIIEMLRELGCQVSLLPDNLHAPPPYRSRLSRLGVAVIYGPVDPVQELREIGPTVDLAILSRPRVASRWLPELTQVAPRAVMVYDTVDLHWLREARRYRHEHPTDADELGPVATAMREQELAIVRGTDITLVVSEVEREQIELLVPEADVRVISNIHRLRTRVAPRVTRSGLLFVGGFEHLPNVEAVVRLIKGVMPLVWNQLPEMQVLVVGPDPPPEIEALGTARVKIAGWVPALDPLLDSSVAMLAPLSYGAGVKGKVTQAMAAGLPVITTPTGAEGIGAVDGEHMLIGESDEALADAVVRLVRDTDLWERLSAAGQGLIAERYSLDAVRSRVTELLAARRSTLSSA
jgi:GT2 family glycosyltransferase/SAM-dependent methyltransferase/glycosyltransferase involved in cell wall biosynthesis